MKRLGLVAGVLVAACGGQEAPSRPPTAAMDTPAASGSATAPAAPTAPAATTSAPAAVVPAPGPPPIGTWNVAREEKVNTCVVPDAGAGGLGKAKPIPSPILVPIHHPKKGPSVATFVFTPSPYLGLRQDVLMEVGKVATSTSKPDKSCGYEVKRETEVKEAGGDRMVVQFRTEYGDPKGCASAITPASCKADIVLTYTLAQKLCDARCEVTNAKALLNGGMDASAATCVCPDAGAP